MTIRREYPTAPLIGIGVVVWREDKVLLIRRGRPPRLGEWSLPGGLQELGETIFEGAVREVREEAGIEIDPFAFITVVDAINRDERARVQYHYTLVEVAAEWRSGTLLAGDDAMDAAWFTRDAAAPLLSWTKTIEVIDKAASLRRS